MTSVPRKIAMLVVSTAALGGLTVLAAPVASAAPAPAAASSARPGHDHYCKPRHGNGFKWHDGRRGGHWDRVIKNRRGKVVDVRHQWRDDRFCAPQRRNGGGRDR